MNEIANAFISQARSYFSEDYLPKIERCLERLSDDQVWHRAGENSNSIGNLLLHLEGNVRQWIVSGLGGAPDVRERDREFAARGRATRETLLSKLRATLEDADAALARLDPDALSERRLIQGSDVTTLEAVFHVVEHFSGHTAQIILLAKILTGDDLAFYDFRDDRPHRNWREKAEGFDR